MHPRKRSARRRRRLSRRRRCDGVVGDGIVGDGCHLDDTIIEGRAAAHVGERLRRHEIDVAPAWRELGPPDAGRGAHAGTHLLADAGAGQEAAARALRNSLGRLLALAEASPALKADEKFRGLQRQLAEIEGRLQMARRAYNEAVRDFNIAVRAFPNALLAWPLGFREAPYFEPDDAG